MLGIIWTLEETEKWKKRKENPCLENLHSNKDIQDFGFIHFN